MKHTKASPIFLYKEVPTQSDSRKIITSRSKSRLRNEIKSNQKHTDRLNPVNYTHRNIPTFEGLNMADQEIRIRREYSPLYQRSTQQSLLFEKGVKKSQRSIDFLSKIDFALNPNNSSVNKQYKDISPRAIGRRDPNRQQQSIFQLANKSPISSRSIKKRDPNVESKQQHAQKSKVKDRNKQTCQTADYVIKALTSHTGSKVKQIHLNFSKKENLLSKENLKNQLNYQITTKSQHSAITSHKRHYSQSTLQAAKNNLQIKQNGICLKQNVQQKNKHSRNHFNHDFYKKENRLPNKQNIMTNRQRERSVRDDIERIKSGKKDYGERNNGKIQLQPVVVNQCKNTNRIAQLRKRFL